MINDNNDQNLITGKTCEVTAMRFITFISLLIVVAFTACATTNSKTTHSRHDMIQLEQIREQLASDAYDLIRKLRPNWLRSRGQRSIHFNNTASSPTVYVNDGKHGDIDSLREIQAEHIKEIRFLNAGEAASRFGLNHAGGAILISI